MPKPRINIFKQGSAATDLNPGFWKWALKVAPKPARFLLAGYLLLVVAASILAWRVSLRALAITAVLLLFSSVAIGTLANNERKQHSRAGSVLNWAFILLLVFIISAFTMSAFFGIPRQGTVLVAKLFEIPELVLTTSDRAQIVASSFWPPEATDVLDVHATRIDRMNALAQRPSLTLTEEHPVGGGTIYVNILTIRGLGIQTDGRPLRIEANKIYSSDGVIKTSPTPPDRASQGPGRPAGDVTLIVHGRIVGTLNIDLLGQSGANGADGGQGPPGAPGDPGEDAAAHLFDCAHGAGAGSRGRPGGTGNPGLPGENGGNGGILRIASSDPQAIARVITANTRGGLGGTGGTGGRGGPGGAGGPGGSDRKPQCQGGGAQGPAGAEGERGPPGAIGPPGHDGAVRTIVTDAYGEIP